MSSVLCLDCDRKIDLNANPQLDDSVICAHCGAEFEMVSIDPPEIEWLYDDDDEAQWDPRWDDEEWDSDWDEDEDWSDDADDDDWSWMIAKKQRLQSNADSSRRSRSREYEHE